MCPAGTTVEKHLILLAKLSVKRINAVDNLSTGEHLLESVGASFKAFNEELSLLEGNQ
jgi:hypothetical protein